MIQAFLCPPCRRRPHLAPGTVRFRLTDGVLASGLVLCLFAAGFALAQPLPVPSASAPPALAARPAATPSPQATRQESEEQTVARCLADLASPDVQVRRRAAMVVGKYASPVALEATLRCLQDPDDQVRQSALVALTEADFLPPAAQPKIVQLLADPSVAIRRIASSALRDSMRFSLLAGMGGPPLFSTVPGGAQRPAGTGAPAANHGPYRELFSQALTDPDAIVRKNILSLGPMLQGQVTPDALRLNLAHDDKEIRVLTLRALPMALTLPPAELVEWYQPLSRDPQAVVRQEVARGLAMAGPAAKGLLVELVDDEDAAVCVTALETLGRMQDESLLTRAPVLLRDERLPLERKQSLLFVLAAFGQRGVPILIEVAKSGSPALQGVALRILGGSQDAQLTADFFLPFVESESREVRTAATMSLLRFAKELKPAQVQKLVAHKDADVRLNALQLLWTLPPELAAPLAGDLVLDDDVDVRSNVLRLIGQRRLPGWQETLRLSLDDAEPRIWRAGVDALRLAPGPESQAILAAALQNSRNPDVKAYLQQPPGQMLLPPVGIRGPGVPLRNLRKPPPSPR